MTMTRASGYRQPRGWANTKARVLERERDGLFDDEVLAGLRRGDRLRRMHRMRRTDVDNVDFGILQHLVVVAIELERQSVFLRQFRFGVGAPRTNRGDFDTFDFFQCLDMRASDPTETDNSGFE